ncbi:MAG TPA: hypothetical protein V6C97_29285 [Oculatellaceae cyanobacterium]
MDNDNLAPEKRLKNLKGKITIPLSVRTLLDVNECQRVINSAQDAQETKLKKDSGVQPLMNPLVPFAEYFIAAPCEAEWKDMQGTDRFRTCERCKCTVYDVKRMSLEDAKSLMFTREGKTPETFYKRTDGTFLTQNCPIGLRNRKIMQQVWIGAILAVLAVVTLVFVAFIRGHAEFAAENRGLVGDRAK